MSSIDLTGPNKLHEAELARQVRGLQHGDHVCLIYEKPEQQRAAMIPYFLEGLARNERCLWIADDCSVDEVKALLHAAGIDVEEAIRKGVFSVLTKRDTYLKDGGFDPQIMVDMLAATVKETKALGFNGLRGSGEMTWALGNEEGCSRAIEYEALLNNFFPGQPFIGICQYNKKRFTPAITLEVLRNHHYAVIGDMVCPNLYFEPTEMALDRSTDELRLEWRLRQLVKAREALLTLERAIQTREAFVAIASHELRTPIAILKLQLQMLERNVGAIQTSQILRAIEVTKRLTDLSETLLDVTQLYAGGVELQHSHMDLAEVIRDVAADYAEKVASGGSKLNLDLVSVAGFWDAVRIRQVVDNLMNNAFKFGADKPIHVQLRLQGSTAEFKISDQGIGIANVDQARIFGPFERAVSENNFGGFGLGLWIVQQVVAAHGGHLELQSASGRGTTVSVYLPCSQATI